MRWFLPCAAVATRNTASRSDSAANGYQRAGSVVDAVRETTYAGADRCARRDQTLLGTSAIADITLAAFRRNRRTAHRGGRRRKGLTYTGGIMPIEERRATGRYVNSRGRGALTRCVRHITDANTADAWVLPRLLPRRTQTPAAFASTTTRDATLTVANGADSGNPVQR